jgi:hypothetical protein
MSRARRYRLQGYDYAKQAVTAPAHVQPIFNLMARSWFELAEREDALARLGEPRSFAA